MYRPTRPKTTEIPSRVDPATNDVTSTFGASANTGSSHWVRNSMLLNGRLSTPPTAASTASATMGKAIVTGDSCGGCGKRAGLGGTYAGTVGGASENPCSSASAAASTAPERSFSQAPSP